MKKNVQKSIWFLMRWNKISPEKLCFKISQWLGFCFYAKTKENWVCKIWAAHHLQKMKTKIRLWKLEIGYHFDFYKLIWLILPNSSMLTCFRIFPRIEELVIAMDEMCFSVSKISIFTLLFWLIYLRNR